MPGIVEGYNYDIFISYRQKDNKGDRWVSEFVEDLKTELDSTFKEEISVYFDINPHENLNHTIYRNQVNKVANAIKEIITVIEPRGEKPEAVLMEDIKPINVQRRKQNIRMFAGSIVALTLMFPGLFFIPKLFKSGEQVEKSIAVLPLSCLAMSLISNIWLME